MRPVPAQLSIDGATDGDVITADTAAGMAVWAAGGGGGGATDLDDLTDVDTTTTPPTTGDVLTYDGSLWEPAASAGGPPSGTAGGVLSGTYPNPGFAASPAFTGNPTAPTPSAADNDTSIATTAFVQGEIAAKAPLASPTFTGDPQAPTASPGDNDTSIATTAFVAAAVTAGTGINWTLVTNVSGATYTSGDWTGGGSPSVSSDGTWIIIADPGGAHARIVRKIGERTDLGIITAVEAEIQIPASGFVGSGTQYIGVGIGPLAAGAGGVVIQATSLGQVHLEREAAAGIATASFTFVAGTTYRLGLRFMPDGRAAGYIDGALVIGPSVMGAAAVPQAAMLKSFDSTAKFKNIKCWAVSPASPWA